MNEAPPGSFYPFTGVECRRLGCQLWVEDSEALAGAFWFLGARALQEFKEARA